MNIWQQLKIAPEVQAFVVLSPKDVQELYTKALGQIDPVSWLSDELNRRGLEKKAVVEAEYAKRRERDKAFILGFNDAWPDTVCCMKEQPWVKSTSRRFGTIKAEDVIAGRWVVSVSGGDDEAFESLDALVEVWSVD